MNPLIALTTSFKLKTAFLLLLFQTDEYSSYSIGFPLDQVCFVLLAPLRIRGLGSQCPLAVQNGESFPWTTKEIASPSLSYLKSLGPRSPFIL